MFENENYEDELSHNDFVLDAIRKWLMWYGHSLVLLNNIGNKIFTTGNVCCRIYIKYALVGHSFLDYTKEDNIAF